MEVWFDPSVMVHVGTLAPLTSPFFKTYLLFFFLPLSLLYLCRYMVSLFVLGHLLHPSADGLFLLTHDFSASPHSLVWGLWLLWQTSWPWPCSLAPHSSMTQPLYPYSKFLGGYLLSPVEVRYLSLGQSLRLVGHSHMVGSVTLPGWWVGQSLQGAMWVGRRECLAFLRQTWVWEQHAEW